MTSHASRALRRGLVLLTMFALVAPAIAQDDAPPASPRPSIAASAVCTAVEDREPVGAATTFPAGTEQLVCFTDVRDAGGQTIVHVWIHEGTTRARVELEIGSDRWRTWSTKKLLPAWTGSWQVKVMTADGAVLETLDFTVE